MVERAGKHEASLGFKHVFVKMSKLRPNSQVSTIKEPEIHLNYF